MYYSANWQLLEERIDDDWSEQSSTDDRKMQYFWGPRYIDDIVARVQYNFNTVQTNVWYHLTDSQFSTVAIINDHDAQIVERVSYDAYGRARHHRSADLTGDGAVNMDDLDAFEDDWDDYGVGDLNRDGWVSVADVMIATQDYGPALPAGQLSSTDNIIGYAGYVFNAEHAGGGLYTVRFRVYSPDLGRWITRDPIGYVDGMGLYEYVQSNPGEATDPQGLSSGGDPESQGNGARSGTNGTKECDDKKNVCGPNVTQELVNVLGKLTRTFDGWTRAQRRRACRQFTSPFTEPVRGGPTWSMAWDIDALWRGGQGWLNAPPYRGNCATGQCASTVAVDGQCFYAGSVNYVLFGRMWKLCGKHPRDMELLIDAYKAPIPLVRRGGANWMASRGWAATGYYGWPAGGGRPRGDRPQCSTTCSIPYQGPPFRFYWSTRGWN